MQLKREKMVTLRRIEQLLRDEWDPIGMMPHLPNDEYDTYAGQVLSRLGQGASAEEIARYLSDVDMTGTPDLKRDRQVAEKALVIFRSQTG